MKDERMKQTNKQNKQTIASKKNPTHRTWGQSRKEANVESLGIKTRDGQENDSRSSQAATEHHDVCSSPADKWSHPLLRSRRPRRPPRLGAPGRTQEPQRAPRGIASPAQRSKLCDIADEKNFFLLRHRQKKTHHHKTTTVPFLSSFCGQDGRRSSAAASGAAAGVSSPVLGSLPVIFFAV